MAVATENMTTGLKSQANELIKQHTTFDAANRPTVVYTAPINATNGKPCTTVSYQYLDATSSRVTGMKEGLGVWNSAWDF